jgi:hypothetical protein
MFSYSTGKALLLLVFPLILLGQVQKKDLVRLPYGELYSLYFDNEKDQAKQIECANAYLKKATTANISIEKQGDITFMLFCIITQMKRKP